MHDSLYDISTPLAESDKPLGGELCQKHQYPTDLLASEIGWPQSIVLSNLMKSRTNCGQCWAYLSNPANAEKLRSLLCVLCHCYASSRPKQCQNHSKLPFIVLGMPNDLNVVRQPHPSPACRSRSAWCPGTRPERK